MKRKILTTLFVLVTAQSQGQIHPPKEFKFFKSADDTRGEVERYKDGKGHEYVFFSYARNIEPGATVEEQNKEALDMAFGDLEKPVKSAEGYYIGSGINSKAKPPHKYYYTVYAPKYQETFSVYSTTNDAAFKKYSDMLLKSIKADKGK